MDSSIVSHLHQRVRDQELLWNVAPERYEDGHILTVDVLGVESRAIGEARLKLDKFIGGGFAGQVYRGKLESLTVVNGEMTDLAVGQTIAIKIQLPSQSGSTRIRNLSYWLGYQGAFSAQVNPHAARVGALWQKLIRRAARTRFGSEECVSDIYATFFDDELGAFGEVREWIEGRSWLYEVDDELFSRSKRTKEDLSKSKEYLQKKHFMDEFVSMLHDMGADELARQYEWGTLKSQTNSLKRFEGDGLPYDGVTAVDFRAGMALMWWLPMSPVDFKLIWRGLLKGRLVQFDKGDLGKLQSFVDANAESFKGMTGVIDELMREEPLYRASLPDITHHWFRLVYDKELRKSVREGAVQGWSAKGLADEKHVEVLKTSLVSFIYFAFLGCVPLLGRFSRRLWGNEIFAGHMKMIVSSMGYCSRALRASQARCLLGWLSSGRVGEGGCEWLLKQPIICGLFRFSFGLLPFPKVIRCLTDWKYVWCRLRAGVSFVVTFYKSEEFRTKWLTDQIEEGVKEGMLKREEADHILESVGDEFIQKYLKSVAVHFCTIPVTQVISVAIAAYAFCCGQSWGESLKWAGGVLLAFQVTPVSPGSLVRGFYVLYLVIKEKNFRDYRFALFISFWHYVGYLAFPIQMVGKFPSLARYMGGRWATKMVHIVPVFGEHGALLEHKVFDLCFNVPLSVAKRWKRKGGES
jgi:hypothetical protein